MADLLTSPLHERHVALGAKFAEFGGWSMPLQYAGVVAEHRAVRTGVGVFDVSHLGKMRVSGPGAADFVNSVITNDLRRITPGQAQYTLLCNEAGGVIDDMICYLISDGKCGSLMYSALCISVSREAVRANSLSTRRVSLSFTASSTVAISASGASPSYIYTAIHS